MLIDCPLCNTRYLVNSAELKPKGRNVKCALCSHRWFQNSSIIEENSKNQLNTQKGENFENYEKKLPSTYVSTEETSILNSALIIIFVMAIIVVYLLAKNMDRGIFNLLTFYFIEFTTQLVIAIDFVAAEIHKIIN